MILGRTCARVTVALCLSATCAVAQTSTRSPRAETADPTATLLAELLRVNTSNPPGNERGIAELLAPRFRALGFEVEIVQTPDSAKAHLIARLRGNSSKRPLLIAAHADVVGVERDKWSVDPFAGVIQDGNVVGRGAIDFKGGMAVFARAAMMLAERKVPLARDVIFLAEADEEGGRYSTSWLARETGPRSMPSSRSTKAGGSSNAMTAACGMSASRPRTSRRSPCS